MSHWALARIATTSIDNSDPVVSRADLKAWLRLDDDVTAEDGLLDGLLLTAEKRLEERWGRAFLTKTYELTLDDAGESTDAIRLLKAPLVSVISITSYDDDNTATVMASSEYRADTASEPGRVICNDEYDWPDDLRTQGGIVVRFTAGYSTAATGVPDGIKAAIKATAAHLYEHRGDDGTLDVPALVRVFDDEYALPEVY